MHRFDGQRKARQMNDVNWIRVIAFQRTCCQNYRSTNGANTENNSVEQREKCYSLSALY